MKKTLMGLVLSMILVACGNNQKDEVPEEVFNCDEIIIKDMDIDYKIVDEDNNEITPSKDEEIEVITKGVKGFKKVVSCNDEYLNEWVYTEKTNEVVKVIKEEPETVDYNDHKTPSTSGSKNSGGSTNPPVTPPTNNGGDTTPPVTPEPPRRLNDLGNSGMEFDTQEEGVAWAESIVYDVENSYLWGSKLGGTEVYSYLVGVIYYSDNTLKYIVNFRVK